jgi:hypothetical protein
MTRYYIDLRDANGILIDDEGADLAHMEDALEEGKSSARDVIKQYVDNLVSLNETCKWLNSKLRLKTSLG